MVVMHMLCLSSDVIMLSELKIPVQNTHLVRLQQSTIAYWLALGHWSATFMSHPSHRHDSHNNYLI